MAAHLDRRGFGSLALAAVTLPAAAPAPVPTWRKLATEAYKGKQDDIAFADEGHGWYGNGKGKLFATVDGGATWALVADRPGTFIRALGFIDAQRGFIGNVGVDYYPGVTDKQPLYRTRDGGRTWEAVVVPGIDRVAGICGIDILPVARIFQGVMRTAHIVHAAGRVGGPAMVLRSADDGDTWSLIDLSAQAGMILDIRFLTATTGFVAASAVSDSGEGEALILRTLDGGKTWAPVYRSGRARENVWKLSFPTPRIGYGTVQSYDDGNPRRVIVKTSDGGATWRELPIAESPKLQLFGIGFVDAQRGWVGARGEGYETRDGGATWTPAAMGVAVNKIRVVRGGGRTRAFAIGSEVHALDL